MLSDTINDDVFEYLSPGNLYRYSWTCKRNYARVQSYIRRRFVVETALRPYFTLKEIEEFRLLQSKYGVIISGSTALQLFNRVPYPGSDLDIYVEGRYCQVVATWLRGIDYVYTPKDPDTSKMPTLAAALVKCNPGPPEEELFTTSTTELGYHGRGASGVLDFYKRDPDRKVQLIVAINSPLEIILNYHSTCVMNFITHEKAYSLYPRGTFEDRVSLVYSTEGTNQEFAKQKYVDRGWTMKEHLSPDDFGDPHFSFPSGNRQVGDGACWVIPLYPVYPRTIPRGLFESNTWTLLYDEDLSAVLHFTNLKTNNLRFSYLVSESARHYLQLAFTKDLGSTLQIDDVSLRRRMRRAANDKWSYEV